MCEIKIGDMVELFGDSQCRNWEVVELDGDRVRAKHLEEFQWADKDDVEPLNQSKADLQRNEAISYVEMMPESALEETVESLREIMVHWEEVDKIRANPPPEKPITERVVDGVVIRTIEL